MSDSLSSRAVLEGFRAVDSATVSNAIEAFQVRDRTQGYASLDLRCLTPELPPLVGYAVTCRADSTTPGPRRPNRLNDLLDALVRAPKPAVIVVQAVGPDRLRSCLVGDMISAAYQKLGASGVVTDGGIRDLAGIRRRAPGFHVFAPGMVVSHGNAAILEANVPVSVCGLDVRPGDLLHGDANGLVLVPASLAAAVLDRARKTLDEENQFFDFLGGPAYSFEGLKRLLGG
ncbi:MAG: RraA family protein [Planctomycetes bacterium]|nr:RraA family protein [Planctomycetota bacterium]